MGGLSTPSKEQMTLKETEKKQKEKEATYQILSTDGFVTREVKDKKNPSAPPRVIYELQFGLLRAITAALTKEYPQAISPAR